LTEEHGDQIGLLFAYIVSTTLCSFLTTEEVQLLLLTSTVKVVFVFSLSNNGLLAIFWTTLTKTHLVTLLRN
jgi:hypothetical protein